MICFLDQSVAASLGPALPPKSKANSKNKKSPTVLLGSEDASPSNVSLISAAVKGSVKLACQDLIKKLDESNKELSSSQNNDREFTRETFVQLNSQLTDVCTKLQQVQDRECELQAGLDKIRSVQLGMTSVAKLANEVKEMHCFLSN